MQGRPLAAIALGALLLSIPLYSRADTVYWHIDPSVKTCSMELDPSLTQSQWHTFAQQAGAALSFKSMTSAEPIGRLKYSIDLDYATTPIDQHSGAWINTFTHPDADCPLGDQIQFPAVRGRLGLSSRMDVGAYWTTAPQANYGFAGAEMRYAFLKETRKMPAAAVSASGMWVTGVPDFNFGVYSLGVAASKRIAMFTPYAGIRQNLAVATEHTSKVALADEHVNITQGFVGATYSFWMIGLGAEYDVSEVNTFTMVIGFHP